MSGYAVFLFTLLLHPAGVRHASPGRSIAEPWEHAAIDASGRAYDVASRPDAAETEIDGGSPRAIGSRAGVRTGRLVVDADLAAG